MKHSISVICLVYNEEQRIKRFIEAFYNFDEIVIINKSSTDKTEEIAKSMGVKVVTIPYTDSSLAWQAGIDAASSEWVFLLVASDVVDPTFVKKLYSLIDNEGFENTYDAIKYPCVIHVLGIESKYSVFDYPYRNGLCKKKYINISDRVHEEIGITSERVYTYPFHRNEAIHHLSHDSLDIYYERQLRYSKEETKKKKSYKRCKYEIFREIYRGIKKKYWKLGNYGFGLLLMMVNYRILIYLRYMEKDLGNIPEKYNQIANRLNDSNHNSFRNPVYESFHDKINKESENE